MLEVFKKYHPEIVSDEKRYHTTGLYTIFDRRPLLNPSAMKNLPGLSSTSIRNEATTNSEMKFWKPLTTRKKNICV
jgi:hypothetical protein